MLSELRRFPAVVLAVGLSVVIWAGCLLVADEKAERPKPPPPAAEAADQAEPDPFAVPDGTPTELAKFIRGLMARRIGDRATFEKTGKAMLEAADKILAAKPELAEARLAVQMKIRFAGASEELEALIAQLKEADMPELVRQVRGAVLTRDLRGSIRQPQEKIKQRISEVIAFLGEEPLQPSDLSLGMTTGQVAEMTGNDELAADTYTRLSKLFSASKNEAVSAMGERLEGVVRRLKLVGKPIELQGVILGGEKLDWAGYRGKVVLIDFWATWCGPCLREIPNMTKTYEAYRERGFEILGFSVDRDPKALEKFLQQREIPWQIVYGDKGPSPSADHYGVVAIPTMILVGADGNVVSTRARGPELDKQLEKLLGPVEKEKVETGEKSQAEKKEGADQTPPGDAKDK